MLIPSSSDGRTKESVKKVRNRFFFWKIRQLKLRKLKIKRADNWIFRVGLVQKKNPVNPVQKWTKRRGSASDPPSYVQRTQKKFSHSLAWITKCVQPQWKLPQSEISFYWNTFWNRKETSKSSFVEEIFVAIYDFSI